MATLIHDWSRYLFQKQEQKRLTDDQFEYLLGTGLHQIDELLGADNSLTSLETLLREFQLDNDFHEYMMEQKTKRETRNTHQRQLQQQLSNLQAKICQMQSKLAQEQHVNDPIHKELENWRNRLQLFPENVNFQTKIQEFEEKLSGEHQLIREIETLQRQLAEQTMILQTCFSD